MKSSNWLVGFCFAAIAAAAAMASEAEPRIYRYSSWVNAPDGGLVMMQNYRFADRMLSMRASDAWLSFESESEDQILLRSRDVTDTSIQIRCFSLGTVPTDAAGADALYRAELAKVAPDLVIRRGRVDLRYVPATGQFPLTFNMARSETTPLIRFYTFFVQDKRLYMVELDTPSRTDIARMFTEYSALMKSLTVGPRPAPENPGQPAVEDGAAPASPEAAPSPATSAQEPATAPAGPVSSIQPVTSEPAP